MKKSEIISAIKSSNFMTIDDFLKTNDINKPIYNGLNILLMSIEQGNLRLVKYLIEKGCDITYNNEESYFPIEYACLCNQLSIVRCLIEVNPNIFENNYSLIYASSKGFSNIVSFLLDKGCSANQVDNTGRNSLHWVAQEGYFDIAKTLISKGCNIDMLDDDGTTPLYIAASENRIEIVRLFIEYGANVDLADEDGTTPFQIACAYNHYDVATILYNAGAQVDYVDSDERTALFYAIVKQDKELISYLITHGASADIVDNQGIRIKDLYDDKIRQKLYDELF